MADNIPPQEELSMEDILSSIKGILSDDETSHQKPKKEEDADDEIYDLSASMIVDVNTEKRQDVPQPEIKAENVETEERFDVSPALSDDGDGMDLKLPEIGIPEFSDAEQKELDYIEIATPASDAEELDLSGQRFDFSASLNSLEGEGVINLETLPELQEVENEEIPSLAEHYAETPSFEGDIPVEKTAETAAPDMNIQSSPDIIDIESDPIYFEEEDKYIPTLDNPVPATEDNEVIDVASEPVYEETKTEEKDEKSAVPDVSADIIDNFARMFSENKTPAPVAEAEPQTRVGMASLTIEDMIKSVIADSLKPVVEQAVLRVDGDILAYAKQEVSAAAKKWVDENLTKVVEDVVREEVKRVMAKVGS